MVSPGVDYHSKCVVRLLVMPIEHAFRCELSQFELERYILVCGRESNPAASKHALF